MTAGFPVAADLEGLGPELDLDLADFDSPLDSPESGFPVQGSSAPGSADLGSPSLGAPSLGASAFGEDSTELLPVGEPWTAGPAESSSLPADEAPPSRDVDARSSASGAVLPAGFDEVARAFATPGETAAAREGAGKDTQASPSLDVFGRPSPWVTSPGPASEPRPARLPPDLLTDETVRLERNARPVPPFAPPPAMPDLLLLPAAQGVGAPSLRSAAAGPTPPVTFPQPARRPPPARRRSAALPVAAALTLFLIGGAAAVYFAFPHLLPAWVPRATDEPFAAASAAGPLADLAAPRAGGAAAGSGEGGGDASPEVPGTGGGAAFPAAPSPLDATERGDAAAAGAAAEASRPGQRRGLDHHSPFSTVDEIWGQQTASGTVVTLVADGAVPAGAYTTFRLDGGNPREVLRLRGVTSRFPRPTIPLATSEVRQVRVGYHERPGGNELHVVVDLTSARVRLVRVVANDNRLELLLAPL
jgi:hypothetical protein